MHALNDVHQQFAEYFGIPALKPYAYLLSKNLVKAIFAFTWISWGPMWKNCLLITIIY
ncbi:hypothetical protein [Paraflavitalea speifideaquila]|uniref:hypothetical protein n=1 Tax=Paraflavitalea speifideaquila TaxID=3076558 RepID=UPI0028EC8477|nr:hypothetical protein [Paraflavitalea speifideiaquila]